MIIIYLFIAASILASLFILSACIAAARVERGTSTAEARRHQMPSAPKLSGTGWIKVRTAEARPQQAPSSPPASPPLKRAFPSEFAP